MATATHETTTGKKIGFTIILITVLISLVVFVEGCRDTESSTNTEDFTPTTQVAERRTLMGSGMVGPDSSVAWVTPKITYKYQIFAPGNEGFYYQFEARGGGWTEKLLLPSGCDDCILETTPNKKPRGKLRITPGPYETEAFEVRLYLVH